MALASSQVQTLHTGTMALTTQHRTQNTKEPSNGEQSGSKLQPHDGESPAM
jgi:hypothetical protein